MKKLCNSIGLCPQCENCPKSLPFAPPPVSEPVQTCEYVPTAKFRNPSMRISGKRMIASGITHHGPDMQPIYLKRAYDTFDQVDGTGRVFESDDQPTPVKAKATQERNASCACGSGKKFKHCCSLLKPEKVKM